MGEGRGRESEREREIAMAFCHFLCPRVHLALLACDYGVTLDPSKAASFNGWMFCLLLSHVLHSASLGACTCTSEYLSEPVGV